MCKALRDIINALRLLYHAMQKNATKTAQMHKKSFSRGEVRVILTGNYYNLDTI